MTSVATGDLADFVDEVEAVLAHNDDEHEITQRLVPAMSTLLGSGYRLPPAYTRPSPERHLNHPVHIASDDRWCLVCVVWAPGQRTPVHGHETWGVVGIYSGAERELRYRKPDPAAPVGPLVPAGEHTWHRGEVTVCCTTDDDVHSVVADSDGPTVGLHVYGGNIGTLSRPACDPATGETRWFVSGWDHPEA